MFRGVIGSVANVFLGKFLDIVMGKFYEIIFDTVPPFGIFKQVVLGFGVSMSAAQGDSEVSQRFECMTL